MALGDRPQRVAGQVVADDFGRIYRRVPTSAAADPATPQNRSDNARGAAVAGRDLCNARPGQVLLHDQIRVHS